MEYLFLWFFVGLHSCATFAANFRTSLTSQKGAPCVLGVTLPFPASGDRSATFCLHGFCLFRMFPINGIVQRVPFIVWLLPLSIKFLRLLNGRGASTGEMKIYWK